MHAQSPLAIQGVKFCVVLQRGCCENAKAFQRPEEWEAKSRNSRVAGGGKPALPWERTATEQRERTREWERLHGAATTRGHAPLTSRRESWVRDGRAGPSRLVHLPQRPPRRPLGRVQSAPEMCPAHPRQQAAGAAPTDPRPCGRCPPVPPEPTCARQHWPLPARGLGSPAARGFRPPRCLASTTPRARLACSRGRRTARPACRQPARAPTTGDNKGGGPPEAQAGAEAAWE